MTLKEVNNVMYNIHSEKIDAKNCKSCHYNNDFPRRRKNTINIFKRLPHFDIFEIGTSIPIPGMTAGVRLPQLRDMNTVFT